MRRRTELVLAFASAGFALGMLVYGVWLSGAGILRVQQPAGGLFIGVAACLAAIAAAEGYRRARALPPDQLSPRSYGVFRLSLSAIGPFLVLAISLRSALVG